jgi:hypothetical protein
MNFIIDLKGNFENKKILKHVVVTLSSEHVTGACWQIQDGNDGTPNPWKIS